MPWNTSRFYCVSDIIQCNKGLRVLLFAFLPTTEPSDIEQIRLNTRELIELLGVPALLPEQRAQLRERISVVEQPRIIYFFQAHHLELVVVGAAYE